MSKRRILDHYKGRISYTELCNMSMAEFQTFSYIMYKENMERIKREREEEEAKQRRQQEEEQRNQANNRPMSRAEMLLQAQRNRNNIITPSEEGVNSSNQQIDTIKSQLSGLTDDDLIEMIEDQL